jgi:RND family efflux transporter MFP subunit
MGKEGSYRRKDDTLKILPDRKTWWLYIALVAFLPITACEEKNTYSPPPPPKVTVAKALQQDVTDYIDFTGTARAFEEVEVRARVPGFLQSMNFTPGTRVEEGAVLFVIDPREYEAELNAAQAELKSAQVRLQRAETEYARVKKLYEQKAAAQTRVVQWQSDRDVAKADVIRATSRLERARLNLGYTKVTTPITGRVGRNLVDLGNLVGEREPTLLTRITKYDPMYVYFNLNERDLLRILAVVRKDIKEKGIDPEKDSAQSAEIPIFLGLADEEGYPHEGILDFAESGVDPGTGTLQMRGVFPNPGQPPKLIPGLFARIRMPVESRPNALLVTERAIGADQGGRYLLTVNSENVVEKLPIRMGQLDDGLRVIEEGLQADAWVVVNGLQRARPGAKVDPQQIDMNTLKVSALKKAAGADKK